ncbi:Regulator of chromosome condensation, RCC1 [Dillenia turbinata]|uniref:Regulator of chromosome condensation, RCC1 n=1 Tax=Dillenia turbinata TaxID=194707 RepID=A0AAN8V519_9MAGN
MKSEFTPRLIKKLEGVKVKRVAAGLLHSACIDENGSVFMFGERVVDKLGFGDAKNATTPDMVGQLPFCEEVACGGYHTCVVTGGGELYTWGSNENGCLGTGCTNATSLPEKVQGPFSRESVSSVSCGWKHTAAISDLHLLLPVRVVGLISYFDLHIEFPLLKDEPGDFTGSEAMFSHGAGEVQMELFLMMDTLLVDNWGVQLCWKIDLTDWTELLKPETAGFVGNSVVGHGNDIDYLGPTLVKFGQNVKALEVSCGFNHSGVILEYVQA